MIWSWLIGTRLGRWLGMVSAIMVLLAIAVVYGWSKRGQNEAAKALRGYQDTRRRMDDAERFGDDIGALRDWLRERGER